MMATASWHGQSDRQNLWRSTQVAYSEIPAVHLVVTYPLLLPLIVFSVHGGFSFEHPSWNSDLGAFGGGMAVVPSGPEAFRDRLQAWVALGICVAAMAPYVRLISGVAVRMPLLLLLPLYAMLSALWSQDAAMSLRSGISLLITTLFAFYLADRFSERQRLEVLLLAGGCVAVASVGLATFWPEFGLAHQLHEGSWQGIFTQKNVCAESTLFLLTPALALTPMGRHGQLLRVLYLALCLLIIFMSRSRTGWAITLLYLAFAYFLRVIGRVNRRDLLPLAAVLFAAVGGVLVAAIAYSGPVLSLFARRGNLSGRWQIWSALMAAILRRPLAGYGFDAFWSLLHGEASRVFASTGWVVTSAHNGFMNVALEIGLVGLTLVGATFVQACRQAHAAFRPGRSPYVDWCIGILFLTLVYNLDERTLMATQYLPWILYIVACAGLKTAACGHSIEEARP